MLNSSFPARSLALTVLVCVIPASAHAGADPKGVWINDTGRGAIEIKDCGNALCGHVVWVKDATDTKGCGKQIIGEARHAGGSTWGGGWVYSPEKKRRYDVELTPVGDDKLRVVGFAGIKLFSRTMVWKRAPADLQRCGATETAAKSPPAKSVEQPSAKSPEVNASEAKAPEVKAPVVQAAAPEAPKTPAPEVKSETADAGATAPETPKAETPAPAPAVEASSPADPAAKSEKAETAKTTPKDDEEDTASSSESETSTEGLSLGDLDLGKVLKRTKGGNCKLDLPWVKIEFGCE
jgi:uncharacterized protein (DUF2147 family)